MFGSILGGRWSDRVFKILKERNGGTSAPEVTSPCLVLMTCILMLRQMRLRSTVWFMIFLPPSVIAYGWVCEQHVNVAAICVMLFLAGFFSV